MDTSLRKRPQRHRAARRALLRASSERPPIIVQSWAIHLGFEFGFGYGLEFGFGWKPNPNPNSKGLQLVAARRGCLGRGALGVTKLLLGLLEFTAHLSINNHISFNQKAMSTRMCAASPVPACSRGCERTIRPRRAGWPFCSLGCSWCLWGLRLFGLRGVGLGYVTFQLFLLLE